MLEGLFEGEAAARNSSCSITDLEGEYAPRLESPRSIDEAKAPRHLEGLEVANTSEHIAARDSNAPFSLPTFSELPPPNGSHASDCNKKRKLEETELGPSVALDAGVPFKRVKLNGSPDELLEDPASLQRERRGDGAVRGDCTTPPNPTPASISSAYALHSRPAHSFNYAGIQRDVRCV